MKIQEIAPDAAADAGVRCFEVTTEDDHFRVRVEYLQDVSLYDEPQDFQATGNLPNNAKLSEVLSALGERLRNRLGNKL